MSNVVDARGLSCPQPVILTFNAIKRTAEDELTVLVDTETAKENTIRAAGSQGWTITNTQREEGFYGLTFRKE